MEGLGDTTPDGVWGLGRGLGWEAEGLGGLLGGTDWGRETCCGVQRDLKGLWDWALGCPASPKDRTEAIGCPGLVARCPYGVGARDSAIGCPGVGARYPCGAGAIGCPGRGQAPREAEAELWDTQGWGLQGWRGIPARGESHAWGCAPVPTSNSEVTLGACDGLPGPAQRQQQRRLGRVGEGPAWVGARGLTGALAPDGCVPQQLRGPHCAPHLRQPLGSWLGLHGPLGTLPRPDPPWPVLCGDGYVDSAGGGPWGGCPQSIHRPWCWPRGIGGDGGTGLRGLRQLLQLPVGHCKGTVGTWGDTPWSLRELCFYAKDRGHVETHKAVGTMWLLAIA